MYHVIRENTSREFQRNVAALGMEVAHAVTRAEKQVILKMLGVIGGAL